MAHLCSIMTMTSAKLLKWLEMSGKALLVPYAWGLGVLVVGFLPWFNLLLLGLNFPRWHYAYV